MRRSTCDGHADRRRLPGGRHRAGEDEQRARAEFSFLAPTTCSKVFIESGKLEAKAKNYKNAYKLMENVAEMKSKSSQFKTSKYICSLCPQELSSKRNLQRHIVLVHSEVKCEYCGEKCKGRSTLNDHSKSCLKTCQVVGCSFKSVYRWRLNKHIDQKHKKTS